MKTIFKRSMPVFALIAGMLFPLFSHAQTLFEVEASGIEFSPNNITINKGDTVRWTNTGGSHNVNGTTSTFPSNPESFGNSVGTGWVYEHVFLNPGSFSYRCDVHFAMGMTGQITVTNINAVKDQPVEEKMVQSVHPNPASDRLIIELSGDPFKNSTLTVFDLSGKPVTAIRDIRDTAIELDTQGWASGLYFFRLIADGEREESGCFIVQ